MAVSKVILEFDDGSKFEVDPAQYKSIFLGETYARRCGHKPPYGKPPGNGGSTTDSDSTLSTASSDSSDTTEPTSETEMAGQCFLVDGVVICPG